MEQNEAWRRRRKLFPCVCLDPTPRRLYFRLLKDLKQIEHNRPHKPESILERNGKF